jgi:hypothetical protein
MLKISPTATAEAMTLGKRINMQPAVPCRDIHMRTAAAAESKHAL